MSTRANGLAGEEQAALFLTQQGYRIVARNVAARGGEIDIVALDHHTLVFVEIKKRASGAFGGPVAAVTALKQRRIARAAVQYIKANSLKFDSIRFDVICILDGKLEHISNAFTPERTTL